MTEMNRRCRPMVSIYGRGEYFDDGDYNPTGDDLADEGTIC